MQGRQNIKLKNPLYIRLQAGFTRWLRVLNFEPSSPRDMPKMLASFLFFLEIKERNQISELQESDLKDYLQELSERSNQKKEGTLSKNYLRKHLQVIRKFSRYLSESNQESFEVKVQIKGKSDHKKIILNPDEIGRLYEAAGDDTLGMRDKAMLALYYGCGLRKNEGLNLNVNDIQLEKELVYVRKGKGYKQRFVPLTGSNKTDLENYLTYSRPYLLNGKAEDALLLSVQGSRLGTVFERIRKLKGKAKIRKQIGAHTFRHSIATHLLQSGMKLEQIQRFLGHSSLESTQIYTHITDEGL